MPVAPEIQPLLDVLNAVEIPADALTVEGMRAGLDGLWMSWNGEPPEVGVSERTIRGAADELSLRVYEPPNTSPPRPCIVELHGGGWTVGSLDSHDATCRHLADRCRALVVAVEYRLAPEHPFPAAPDDCLASLRWIAEHAGELGVDPDRIVLAGDSAGANLAAVTALAARDAGIPVALQVLVYPAFDHTRSSDSYHRNGTGHLLTADVMDWFWSNYLNGSVTRDDWRVDPRRADLTGAPPAIIITAEYDPLVDEGAEYARMLAGAGVNVEYVEYEGMVHGFFAMYAVTPRALEAVDRVATAVASL